MSVHVYVMSVCAPHDRCFQGERTHRPAFTAVQTLPPRQMPNEMKWKRARERTQQITMEPETERNDSQQTDCVYLTDLKQKQKAKRI